MPNPATEILVDPAETDRDVGRTHRWAMDGGPAARFGGSLNPAKRSDVLSVQISVKLAAVGVVLGAVTWTIAERQTEDKD